MTHNFLRVASIFAVALISAFFPVLADGPALAWEVTLAWDPNGEADLDGYTVYYSKHTPGPPYDYVGDLPLDSLQDPNRPMMTLTGLEEDVDYYFALTAYDTEGNESSFSRQLCVRSYGAVYECAPAPASAAVSLNSGGGSGGSSSCFVTAAEDSDPAAAPRAVPLILSILAVVFPCILPAILSRGAASGIAP